MENREESGLDGPPRADRAQRGGLGTGTLDLALQILEFLAHQSQPCSLGAIAKNFSASKATVYRHLQALLRRGFVHQDPVSARYEAGIKLVVLGEAARGRFDLVRASRDELIALRDATQQAVTICGLVQGGLVVLELIQGQTVVEFGTRPGTRLTLEVSAHGKVWMAFGPDGLLEKTLASARIAGARRPNAGALTRDIETVRKRGWATAPDQIIRGVNALAAPIFDHAACLAGSVAIVGATELIHAEPNRRQIEAVVGTARKISTALGWRPQ
ncbi:MAG: IclR family transcriptional regulator [Xanthobacteraceae bacterium]